MKSETELNLARLAHPVTSLGPGRRLVVWVAGCSLHCAGCISPELRDPANGKPIGVDRLATHILQMDTPLDGVTFTGGEPFEQAGALAQLWRRLSKHRPAWNWLAFSGYPIDRLRQGEAGELLAMVDLLVAGPYLAGHPSTSPLAASANQLLLPMNRTGEAMTIALKQQTTTANLGRIDKDRDWLIGILDSRRRRRIHRQLGVSSSLEVDGKQSMTHG